MRAISLITNTVSKAVARTAGRSQSLSAVVPWRVYGFHFGALILVYMVFMITGLITEYPDSGNLVQWDSCWYRSLANHGYMYVPGVQCNLAFFPLFPTLWHSLQASAMTMSLINLGLMLAGLTLVTRCIYIKPRTLLLILSAPSIFFCYVPYSEAIFFFSCSLLLFGLRFDRLIPAAIGIMLACLSRPAASLMFPVIAIYFLLNYRRATLTKDIRRALILLFTAASTTLFVLWIQYKQTGMWFKFFEVQSHWGRDLNFPKLFFTTWGDWRWIWLDGLAFFIGFVCMVGVIYLFIRKIKDRNKTLNPVLIFSMGYLMMAALIAVFFGPQAEWIRPYGTSVYSVGRFVIATPFFAIFIGGFLRYIKIEFKTFFVFLILADVVGFMFAAFTGMDQLIYWAVASLYASVYIWHDHVRWSRETWTALYLINIIFQMWMFNSFLHGGGIL